MELTQPQENILALLPLSVAENSITSNLSKVRAADAEQLAFLARGHMFPYMYLEGGKVCTLDRASATNVKWMLESTLDDVNQDCDTVPVMANYLLAYRRMLIDGKIPKGVDYMTPLGASLHAYTEMPIGTFATTVEADLEKLCKTHFRFTPKISVGQHGIVRVSIPKYNANSSFQVIIEQKHYSPTYAFCIFAHIGKHIKEALLDGTYSVENDVVKSLVLRVVSAVAVYVE